MQPSQAKPDPRIHLVAANCISSAELAYGILQDYHALKNTLRCLKDTSDAFEQRLPAHLVKLNVYEPYYEFTLTNDLRNWKYP